MTYPPPFQTKKYIEIRELRERGDLRRGEKKKKRKMRKEVRGKAKEGRKEKKSQKLKKGEKGGACSKKEGEEKKK